MRNSRMKWLGLVLVGFLASCGSSSDGGGGSGTFTANKAALVAGEGVGGLSTLSDVAEFTNMIFSTWIDSMMLTRVAARTSALPVPVTGVCTAGTLDADLTDTDTSEDVSAGDSVVFTFTGCVLPDDGGGSQTFNGTLNGDVTAVLPVPTVDVTFGSGFTVDDGTSTTEVSGGFTYSVTDDPTTGDETVTINGSSLSLAESGHTATVTAFMTTFTSNEDAGTFSLDGTGTVATSDLKQTTVIYDTTTPLSGTDGFNPDTGIVVIDEVGGDGIITVTVIDDTSVRIAFDGDGDGTPESTTTALWDDF